ncbi:SRPBCC family protein [Nocardia sp. BMG111209]|uniref:SRPBCC family protein n=1 Tax=Nocardia sp. BMG111209 TaxID=1160137 RepID=UPI00037AC4A3|nr:SRPBCC family protein [Nocardia sp. BMG111209]
MKIVERAGEVAVPRDFVFRYVADHRNVPAWMFGVTEFRPRGTPESGAGSVFVMTFTNPIATTELELHAVEWRDDAVIELRSTRKPLVTARFEFETTAAGATRIRVRIGYPPATGAAGLVTNPLGDLIAATAVRHVETTLRREVTAAFHTDESTQS